MNQLDKLIEQYERENPGCFALEGEIQGDCDFYKGFVLWLANRPTCGVEQRKFLDEVESLQFDEEDSTLMSGSALIIFCDSFESDMQKVIKGG